MDIKVGDTVKVVGVGRRMSKDSAEVKEIRDDIPLGVRVSRPLAGFFWWGVDDLVVVDNEDE